VLQAEHLAGSHRRLGYAYPAEERVAVFARPRLEGVRTACAELGLPEPHVLTVPLRPEGAAEAVRTWLAADPPVTGICAFNDEVAMAVLAGLRHLGLRAPDDLAVVGVDDVPAAAVAAPPLTTVVQDYAAIAEHHARSVVAALAGQQIPAPPVKGDYRLEVRESG
jgi:DNA-binding LacI/PurR family transcriptional regulator